MPSDSREYYHTSGSRSQAANDRHLPPIRDVVGEELDRRTRPNPYAFNDVRGALPTSGFIQSGRGEHRGPTLPPIQQGGYSSSRDTAYPGSQGRYPSPLEHATEPQSQRVNRQADYRTHPSQEPDYAYGVLRTSGTGSSLVHAIPPAPRAQGILRQGGAPPQEYEEDPDKRHKCEYCGKKFDRPSSLQVHVRTHTGSQPFACEWPGCDRTFSVRSNMLRHYRSHERSEVSHYPAQEHRRDQGEEDDELDEHYSRGKSSSSTGQHSGSNYYSSSRRR